ncbi:hypothetical protein K504DRAFT_533997 [Pleomassaria siparia CBS 279.74]|uniref:Uncharacterized protein n=1 Tax=Pleomassaria siparia CBS 279.74 TaxID=1314801 RepID=A0A6G1KA22_9PLEO|nr:hypothetical protein K504DRAFT_533997 [Pleomassaria siparia CBS 279.74]
MSQDSLFQLKHTNVSRPLLSHSGSKQSIIASEVASEGYYSFSENTSSEGDDRSKLAHNRYSTPPSHNRTPAQSHEHLHQQQQHTEAPVTSLKGIGVPRQYQQQQQQQQQPANTTSNTSDRNHPQLHSSAVSTIAEERPETQESRRNLQQRSAMDSQSVATTPGMDNTPYIRFAIDQLTRDEEVRGSRLYPQVGSADDDDDYPVERLISDDGLGYMDQEQERERRQSRMSHSLPPKPLVQVPVRSHDIPVQNDVFTPVRPAHSPLHFLPAILRPLSLGIFIILCLAMLAGLIFSAIYSNRDSGRGLWDYVSFGDNRYFVFEYLPTMLGMLIYIWLLQIQVALQRIVPFLSMASESLHQRSEAVFLSLYPMQFLLPKVEHFRAGQPLIGACYVIFWLFSWTIPLLASAFNVRYDLNKHVWRWVAVQGVLWAIVVLYILLILVLIAMMAVLYRNQTGLKWDPRSLADIISMVERSNSLNDYNGAETFDKAEFRQRLGARTDRIGYWNTTKRPNDVFYGIGEEGGATRRYSVEQGRIREKAPERASPEPLPGTQRPGDFSIRMDIRSPGVRLKYLPWYLRDTSVIAWIVTALVLLITWLVVSFVNSAVRQGFLPQVMARTDSMGFSASNFLYSFVPALIGHILFLVILTFDYSLRALRPYISLSSKGGATAETSLLLDYSARLPVSVTLSALENKHYQTAFLSLVSLCSLTLPILAGGCFWTQYYLNSDVVKVAAHLSSYYALCFFLALYGVSMFALLPGRRRAALPHRSSSLAEIVSWVYQSQILSDRAFSRPQTKPELVTRLMGSAYLDRTWTRSLTNLVRPSRDNLRGDSPTDPALKLAEKKNKDKGHHTETEEERRNRDLEPGKIKYGFGIHVGRDGLEHLGIDRVKRGERSGRELVIWEEQRRRSWSSPV